MNINITPEQVDALYAISQKGLHRLRAEINSVYDAALDFPTNSELVFDIKKQVDAFEGYCTMFERVYQSFKGTENSHMALSFMIHLKSCKECYDSIMKLNDQLWATK